MESIRGSSIVLIFVVLAAVSGSATLWHHSPGTCRYDLGYERNPFSNTCFRLVRQAKTWVDASSYCRQAGEALAVLDSVESINWFKNLRQTNTAWKSGWIWIGGKRVSGQWNWYGRVDNQKIQLADWEHVQPDGGDNYCIQVFDGNRAGTRNTFENYKWDDTPCTSRLNFVCEKQ